MFLVQILLPAQRRTSSDGHAAVARTRAELVERFGGVTAYVQTPAIGEWTAPGGHRDVDRVVMVEVVAAEFDRAWWRQYAAMLADRFRQDAIHVRALHVEMLDPRAA
jgi:hypothetical protein